MSTEISAVIEAEEPVAKSENVIKQLVLLLFFGLRFRGLKNYQYIGIMDKKVETTIMGNIRVFLG